MQVQGDADFGRARVAQRPGGQPVAEQQVVGGGRRGGGVAQSGRMVAVTVAVGGDHLRLVQGDPAGDPVAERLPYTMYDSWLDRSLATGSAATGDYERLNDPAVQAQLATLAGASTTAQQTAALAPIAKFVAADLPIIPTTTASDWFEYNSQNYTGWPTQDNPYESGQPSGTNNGPGSGTDGGNPSPHPAGLDSPQLSKSARPWQPPAGGGPQPRSHPTAVPKDSRGLCSP